MCTGVTTGGSSAVITGDVSTIIGVVRVCVRTRSRKSVVITFSSLDGYLPRIISGSNLVCLWSYGLDKEKEVTHSFPVL